MLVDVSRDNPMRPPDWRWQRAMGVVDGSQPNPGRKFDGALGYRWIKRAVNFKVAYENCGSDDLALRRLANMTPDIYWAHKLWHQDKQLMRWDVEARLLARCNNFEAAYSLGLPDAVVEAYENLFFNVREKLQHSQYILHCVIGEAVQRGLSEREYDTLWKIYGYYYGPHVLQTMTSKFVNPGWCASPDTAGSTLQDDAISSLKYKAAIAAKTVPVNGTTQIDLLNVFTKFIEVERTTDSAGKAQGQILDHIQAMMVGLPFDVGGRDPKTAGMRAPSLISHYRQSAIELSFGEMTLLSAGQQIPYGPQLETLEFPVAGVEAGGSDANAE